MMHLKDEFNQRFPVANHRKDFFLRSQGTQQFTAYVDGLCKMAVEADLSNATAENIIVFTGIVKKMTSYEEISKSSRPPNSRI